MKNFYLNFAIAEEDTLKFLASIEDYENQLDLKYKVSTDEGVLQEVIENPVGRIFIDCPGGIVSLSAMIYHVLSTSKYEYEYVISGCVDSAAFFLLTALAPKNITIYSSASAMIHYSYFEINTTIASVKNHHGPERDRYENHKKEMKKLDSIYKKLVDKDKYEKLIKGADVHLSSKEVSKIFNNISKDVNLQNLTKRFFELT